MMKTFLIIGVIAVLFLAVRFVPPPDGFFGAIPNTTFEDLPNVAKEQGLYRITFDEWSDVEIPESDIPEVKLKKWGDETFIKIKYSDFDKKIKPKQEDKKLKWKGKDMEVHLYQEGEKNFEFEIVLEKKPATNVITLDIETYGLDFYYQAPLNEEIRPENYWEDSR